MVLVHGVLRTGESNNSASNGRLGEIRSTKKNVGSVGWNDILIGRASGVLGDERRNILLLSRHL